MWKSPARVGMCFTDTIQPNSSALALRFMGRIDWFSWEWRRNWQIH
jgi:hypothetical protein